MLKVSTNPESHVPDFEALDSRVRRYHGRRFSYQSESFQLIPDWVGEIPERAEYLQALKEGSLIPRNEYTAKRAGIPFQS
jgi:hypothetical protein